MTTIKSILFSILFIAIAFQVKAQKNYTISKSAFEVAGTSNLHDWVMKSTEAIGSANLTVTDSKITAINGLSITLLAESIKSSKTSMDDVAYETLETKEHKYIKYVLKAVNKVNETTWNLTGTFTIAGVSKDFRTQINVTANNDTFTLKGTNRFTFADFEMSPPTAALGVVKAGKELTVIFNITLNDYSKNENELVIK